MTSTKKLFKNHVVFAIDNNNDLHNVSKFLRYIDTLSAMQKLTYKPAIGTGMWEGQLEQCYMMDYEDFIDYVIGSGYVDHQECFLHLSPRSPRSFAYMGFLFDQDANALGRVGVWTQVTQEEAFDNQAYSYFDGKYFVCI